MTAEGRSGSQTAQKGRGVLPVPGTPVSSPHRGTVTREGPPAVGCRHWSGVSGTWCAALPTRRYLPGDRCTAHAPGAVPETPEGAGGEVVTDRADDLVGEATAEFSPCRTYRYALTRTWDDRRLPLAFVMLNPSTADAFTVDPTVRRCLDFARRWGAGGLLVLNLYALRATDPKALRGHPDPIGPVNDDVIARRLAQPIARVVAGWGAHGDPVRAEHVAEIVRAAGHAPTCLGRTKSGAPRHPLYLRADSVAVPL